MIQQELDTIRHAWNTHRIRQSKDSSMPAGIPNVLFYLTHIEGDTSVNDNEKSTEVRNPRRNTRALMLINCHGNTTIMAYPPVMDDHFTLQNIHHALEYDH